MVYYFTMYIHINFSLFCILVHNYKLGKSFNGISATFIGNNGKGGVKNQIQDK